MVINHLLTGMMLEVGKIRSSSRPSQRGGLYWTSDDFDCLCRIFFNDFWGVWWFWESQRRRLSINPFERKYVKFLVNKFVYFFFLTVSKVGFPSYPCVPFSAMLASCFLGWLSRQLSKTTWWFFQLPPAPISESNDRVVDLALNQSQTLRKKTIFLDPYHLNLWRIVSEHLNGGQIANLQPCSTGSIRI